MFSVLFLIVFLFVFPNPRKERVISHLSCGNGKTHTRDRIDGGTYTHTEIGRAHV